MKSSAILVAVLAVFFSVATCVVYDQFRSPGDDSGGIEIGSVEFSRVTDRLTAIEGRLDEIARAESARAAQLASSTARVRRSSGEEGSERLVPSKASSDRGSSTPEGDSPSVSGERLAKWLAMEGGDAELRGYVAGIVEEERKARVEREQREREERQRERRELQQGPYGRHNFRVNSMAKKLAFDEGQRDAYHELIVRYSERRKALREADAGEALKSGNPAQIAEHFRAMESQRAALGEEFDQEIASWLSDDQLATYEDLPAHERGPGGSDSSIFAFDGDQGTVIRATSLSFDAPLAIEAVRSIATPPEPVVTTDE